MEEVEQEPLYFQDDQQILVWRDRLMEILFEKVKELTERQREIVEGIYIKGYNQTDLANKLGVHQTTVHKTLHGNVVHYKDKTHPCNGKRYGGSLPKLKRMMMEDGEVIGLLGLISNREKELAEDLPVAI